MFCLYNFYSKFFGFQKLIFVHLFLIQFDISDPSIEGDTPFVSCKSSNEIFCQEISNAPTSSITYDIKEQLRYNTWQEIEEIYNGLNIQHPNDFL